MHNASIDVDMEKGRVQEVVNDEMIIRGEDDKFQYWKDEDVEIIIVQKPLHQQLEKELLTQPKEVELTKKNQQEEELQ